MAYWFVGSIMNGSDHTSRFLQQDIWEHDYSENYLKKIENIQTGDRIALKSTNIQKYDLPFDNPHSRKFSVMQIKAIGTVKNVAPDGTSVDVAWEKHFDPARKWYFYTNVRSVWEVVSNGWYAEELIAFAFEGKDQDISRFTSVDYWNDRIYGVPKSNASFEWTRFYMEFADKLLSYRDRRSDLLEGIYATSAYGKKMLPMLDEYQDGSKGPLRDICPFTTMGLFNRGLKPKNSQLIAGQLAEIIGVSNQVPNSFESLPQLYPGSFWFFGFENKRKVDDIDKLWEIFFQGIKLADSESDETLWRFNDAYDKAAKVRGAGWNITMGLYWIRPLYYPTLDDKSRKFIEDELNIPIQTNGPGRRCNSNDYLAVKETIEQKIQSADSFVSSFQELSLRAYGGGEKELESYGIDSIVGEGCFLTKEVLVNALDRLQTKKNLILQGPPGTGKTWLAKRLAYALIAAKNNKNVRSFQFHPNLTYEDFICGWRPTISGNEENSSRLTLTNGPFIEMIEQAKAAPSEKLVIVIEEINRGNPAQIFGEMLTLLEADKRKESEALELTYSVESKPAYIPENLHIIGTMNVADRSLAIVDFALRRRFAFIDLEPTLGVVWRDWVHQEFKVDKRILLEIEKRINSLNKRISDDSSLGPQFRIGHSFATPAKGELDKGPIKWFKQVVETEIGPLLQELWFDSPDVAESAKQELLKNY